MKAVGMLLDEARGRSREQEAAWRWLESRHDWSTVQCPISQLAQFLSQIDALWIHDDTSILLPQHFSDPEIRTALRTYVEEGGTLMLSLLAAQAVVPLGWESTPPNVVRKGTWDERCWAQGYPDIRGFSGFLGHPIFEGLRGAVYTWSPTPETPFAGAWYESPSRPLEGRVVAVERQYIKLNDERRLVWEYRIGKGAVLALGSFLFFEYPEDRFRMHREMLAANCLTYLLDRPSSRTTYWDFGEREVREFRQSSLPVSVTAAPLPEVESGLAFVREPGEVRDNVFDLGGRRIVVMGREQTGIQEIWCHPVRAARDVRLGIRSGDREVKWLADVAPKVTVRPECVHRVFDIGEVRIEETTCASEKDPAAVIHLAMNSTHPFELVVSCQVDLRLMWPFPDHATGSLAHAWDEGLRAFVVHNASEGLATVLGSTRHPDEFLSGHYAQITVSEDGLTGLPSENIEVGLGMRFSCRPGSEEFSLVLAGSGQGPAEALAAYRHALKHPGSLLLRQVEHFRRLFGTSTMLRTPDERFNDQYRWALAALDRFVVETPSLGTSLMAGFGTTDRGWDGNQAISGRPGYAWYFGRDAVWSALALLGAGQCESVKEVLSFLGRHQDVTGKILHELTTSGHAHYDAADATPLYCILMGRYLHATGDVGFVEEEFPRLVRAMDFCSSTDRDHDQLIENTNVGHGWIEGGKLFPVHTELYLAASWAEALRQSGAVAQAVGDEDRARTWSEHAERVRSLVAKDFWNEASQFYSFAKMADGSYRNEKTILPAVAAYFRCVDPSRMLPSMMAYASAEFSSDWGVRIIGRSESTFNPVGYHSGSVWPLFTGWVSLAEFELGRPLQGLDHVMRNLALSESFSAGYAEEVLHGERFEPAGVCSHQAWSESMALQPALEGLLGLATDARLMRLSLRPYLPGSWDGLSIDHLSLGEERLDVRIERKHGKMNFWFRTKAKGPIAVSLQMLLPLGSVLRSRTVGRTTTALSGLVNAYADSPVVHFTLTGNEKGSVQYTEGVALEPAVVLPKQGFPSSGVRCLDERMDGGTYTLVLEAPDEQTCSVVLRDPAERITQVRGATDWARQGERVLVTLDAQGRLEPTGYRRTRVSVELAPKRQ